VSGCGKEIPKSGQQGWFGANNPHLSAGLGVGTGVALLAGVRLCSVLTLLAASGPAVAQTPPRALALRDAIALAVKGNPALLAAGADLRIAQAGVLAARGLDDFVLEANADWVETRRELVPGTPVQQPAIDELNGALALIKPLASGGRVGLGLLGGFNRTRFATDLDSTAGGVRSAVDEYQPSLRLSLQHPLLRGFGVGVARAPRRRAAAQTDLATAQREGTAATIVRDVEAAYWDLAYATQELAIRRRAAESARDQLRRVQANIEVGKQPRSASAEIDVAVAFRDEAVLFAEQSLAERALELGRLMGMRLGSRSALQLSASDPPSPPARALEEAAAVESALARNPQLLAVRAQGRAAAIEVDVTRNGLLPQLDIALSGGPVGNARELETAARQLRGLDNYIVTAALVFQQPLGRHAARGAHQAARETVQKVRLTETDIADQVSGAVVRALVAVDVARRRVDVLARSTDAAALDLEAERARFEVGRSTNFDVLRRQDALAGAQLVHLRARVDQLKALAFIDALTGEILDRHGVSLARSGS
jgi:outer membrane protein TolC